MNFITGDIYDKPNIKTIRNFCLFVLGEKRNDDEMAAGKVDVSTSNSPYGTHLITYSDDDFDKLVNLSEYNIMNNQHMILQALNAAVARKRQSYYSN